MKICVSFLLVGLLTACVAPATSPLDSPLTLAVTPRPTSPNDGVQTTTGPTVVVSPPGQPPVDLPGDPAPAAAMARQDLARRLKVEGSLIEVVEITPLNWEDGATACPNLLPLLERSVKRPETLPHVLLSHKGIYYSYVVWDTLVIPCEK